MSAAPTTVSGAQPPLTAVARLGAAVAQVAFLPAAVQGAFRTLMYDLMSHHRLRVIGRAGQNFPGRREAQKMVATRLYRYTKLDPAKDQIAGVVAEGFAAAESGDTYGPGALARLEKGGTVTAKDLMVVPVGQGAQMARSPNQGRRQQFRDMIASRQLVLVRRPGRTPLLIKPMAGRKSDGKGARAVLMAVLSPRRHQPALLRYAAEFDAIVEQHLPQFEKGLELAATEAGQAKLVEQAENLRTGGVAYARAYKAYLDANPGSNAAAAKVAKAAAREARKRLTLTRRGEKA